MIPLDYLSENGFIAEVSGEPAAAGFIYRTDSAVAVFEYVVTNPKLTSSMRSAALNLLITYATEFARGLGFKAVFMACGSKSLAERMADHGFTVIGSEVFNLMRRL